MGLPQTRSLKEHHSQKEGREGREGGCPVAQPIPPSAAGPARPRLARLVPLATEGWLLFQGG